MNRIRAAASTAINNVGAIFTSLAQKTIEHLALVPTYLGHLLWLIKTEYFDLVKRAYGQNAAVYACLRLLANSVPEPPLVAYQRQADGEPGDPIAWSHPLRALIRRPNPLQTEYEFWELTTLYTAVSGIAHWWKERDNAGRIIALWPLRPDRCGPIYATTEDYIEGRADNPVLLGWSYLIPGTTKYLAIPRKDVVTFNFPDPVGSSGGIVEGFGPLQALASEISADNEATNYVGSLVANYATPGMVLQVQGKITDQNTANLLKQSFIRQYGGTNKGEPAIIDAGSTITSVGFNLQELEFPSLRKISESRIAAAIGVPPILVGLLVGLEAGIKATIDEQRAHFAETTLSNYWRRYSDQYTNDVASEFGPDFVCLFDISKVRALAAQAAEELERIALAYQNEALTKNEYREALGYEKREDGDCYISGIGSGRGQGMPVDALPLDPNADPNKSEPAGASKLNRPPPEPANNGQNGTANGSNGNTQPATPARTATLAAPASVGDFAEGHGLADSALDALLDDLLAKV